MPMRYLKKEREKWQVGWRARWAFGGPEISRTAFGYQDPQPVRYFGWQEPTPVPQTYFGGPDTTDEEYFGWRGGYYVPFGAVPKFPPVDIYEDNGNLVVVADIPGFKKDEISLKFKGDELVISGKRKEKEEIEEERYYRFERYFDTFTRTIRLPVEVDPKGAKASFKDGVLTVTMPIVSKEEGEEIPIE